MNNRYPEINEEQLQALRVRYGEDVLLAGPDTLSGLGARIEREASTLNRPIISRVPSSFDIGKNEFFPIPHHRLPVWQTLGMHFDQFSMTGGALFVTELTLQLLPTFWDTCQKKAVFVALGDKKNIPLCTEIIREARVSMVIVEAMTMLELTAALRARSLEDIVKLFVVIRGAEEKLLKPFSAYELRGAKTIFEIHLFPGHPIAYQSLELWGSDKYYLNKDYLFEFNETTLVTGLHPDALPLVRFPWRATCTRVPDQKTAQAFTIDI